MRATRAALDRFRDQVGRAGLPGVHLNAVAWGQPILPGESRPSDLPQLIKDLGFDSTTSYVWIHHVPLPRLQTDYNEVRDAYNAFWERATNLYGIPYFPNVSMGWDSSPRQPGGYLAAIRDVFGRQLESRVRSFGCGYALPDEAIESDDVNTKSG